jgi:hypothetical protein
MGLDQGLAARAALRGALGASTLASRLAWRWRLSPGAVRADRDTRRFFPHQAGRMEGLARGAGVLRAALAAHLERGTREPLVRLVLAAEPSRSGEGALLACTVPAALDGHGGFVIRRSEPEHDYRSLEVVPAFGLAGLAGVNERGLAAAASSVPSAEDALWPCAAPAELLVQDCLQRFDTVEKAVEWCARRPAGGRTRIVLADAAGHLAAVDVDGASRGLRAADAGVLIGLASESVEAALAKSAAARAGSVDARALAELLAEAAGPDEPRVLLDPQRRRLGLWGAGQAQPRWLGV